MPVATSFPRAPGRGRRPWPPGQEAVEAVERPGAAAEAARAEAEEAARAEAEAAAEAEEAAVAEVETGCRP